MAKSFNATIKSRLNTITTNGDKLNKYIHDTGMLILRHAAPEALGGHGDCDMALQLVKAMPASMRRTMMIAWFAKFSPVVVKLGDSEAVGFSAKYKNLKSADAKAACWDIEAADAEPFYMIAEATPEDKAFDLEAMLKMVAGLAARIEKKIEDGSVSDDLTDTAKAIARQLSAIKAPTPAPANDGDEDAVAA